MYLLHLLQLLHTQITLLASFSLRVATTASFSLILNIRGGTATVSFISTKVNIVATPGGPALGANHASPGKKYKHVKITEVITFAIWMTTKQESTLNMVQSVSKHYRQNWAIKVSPVYHRMSISFRNIHSTGGHLSHCSSEVQKQRKAQSVAGVTAQSQSIQISSSLLTGIR